MFFRNLTIYRFPQSFGGLFPSAVADELGELDTALDQCRLRPVGPMELASRGFVSPFGRGSEQLTQTVGRATWFTLGGEDKILPAAVVNDLLAKKVAEIEEREGRSPLGRARKRLKEELVAELLPRAFVKPGRCDAYFDFDRCLLLVDTSSRNRADQVVGELRRAIGSFPALPLNAEVAPRVVLTGWVAGEALPEGLSLGEECELRGANDERVVIRNLDLQSEEVATHLEAGMQCTRLALVLDDHVSFVFGEDMVVRKLKFLDGAVEALDDQEHEDQRAELDARFALQVGELGRLFDMLEAAFKITPVEDDGSVVPEVQRKPRAAGAARKAWNNLKTMAGEDGRVTISDGNGQVLLDSADPAKGGSPDPLYPEARELVHKTGHASISRVQRVLKVGYNRAARLIEALEASGEVSRPDAQGKRQVLSRSLQ